MQIIRCLLIAGAATVLAVMAMLTIRPPEGNGFMSEKGAFILTVVGGFIMFFPLFWFPSLLVGFITGRKDLSKAQKMCLVVVMIISALAFVGMICSIGSTIMRRS